MTYFARQFCNNLCISSRVSERISCEESAIFFANLAFIPQVKSSNHPNGSKLGNSGIKKSYLKHSIFHYSSKLLWVKSKFSNSCYKMSVFWQNTYIPSRSMGNICKCKQTFGLFIKLILLQTLISR